MQQLLTLIAAVWVVIGFHGPGLGKSSFTTPFPTCIVLTGYVGPMSRSSPKEPKSGTEMCVLYCFPSVVEMKAGCVSLQLSVSASTPLIFYVKAWWGGKWSVQLWSIGESQRSQVMNIPGDDLLMYTSLLILCQVLICRFAKPKGRPAVPRKWRSAIR